MSCRALSRGLLAVAVLAGPAGADVRNIDRPRAPWLERNARSPTEPPAIALGITVWRHAVSGTLRRDDDETDLEGDLGMEAGLDPALRAAFRHPINWLPDPALDVTFLRIEGTHRLDEPETIEGTRFEAGERLHSDLGAVLADLTLSYRPLCLGDDDHPWLTVDLGVTGRHLGGGLHVRSRTTVRHAEVDLAVPIVPMGYLAIGVLPFRAVAAAAELRAVSFEGSTWIDAAATLRTHPFGPHLALGAGWRHQQITLTDVEDGDADLTLSGFIVAAELAY